MSVGFGIPPRPPGSRTSTGRDPSWLEGAAAEFQAVRAVDTTDAETRHMREASREFAERFEAVTGRPLQEVEREISRNGRHAKRHRDWRDIEAYIETLPEEQRNQLGGQSSVIERSREIALDKYYSAQDVRDRVTGAGTFGSGLVGGTVGAMTDPLNIGAMLLFRAPASSFVRGVAYEAAVGAGAEAAIQPAVQNYRKELGLDHGFGQGMQNVLYAGLGGGAFEGVGRGLKYGLDQAAKRARRAKPDDLAVEDAASLVEDYDAIQKANPFPEDSPAGAEHFENVKEAAAAFVEGRKPEIDDTALADDLPAPASSRREFRPEDLIVDAARFQYKAGGDEFGVLDTLKTVKRWEDERSGVIMVWEDRDGNFFLVDGHQRHGLASRIKAADPSQDPRLHAYVLREVDGVTADDARVRAALKNIGEDSGTATDAATIFRAAAAAPDADKVLASLPLSSGAVDDGLGLSRLSDRAFDLVQKGVISERVGAAVGRSAADRPQLHVQLAETLQSLKPSSRAEADFMVQDFLRASAVEETTSDLFGEQTVQRLLIKERATILKAATAQLSKDRRAFDLLVREQDRLETEGNQLAAENNLARVNSNVKTAYLIEKQAQRNGPVSDALSDAAERLAGGASKSSVVRKFIEDVRDLDLESDTGNRRPAAAQTVEPGPAYTPDIFASPEASPAIRQKPDVTGTDIRAQLEELTPQAEDQALDIQLQDLKSQLDADPAKQIADPDSGDMRPLADVIAEIEADDDAIKRLEGCVVRPQPSS